MSQVETPPWEDDLFEPVEAAPNAAHRPLVGFFAGLSDEQKKLVLDYRGSEAFGDPELLR